MSSATNIAAVYDTHAEAEQTGKELQKSSFFTLKTDRFLVLAHGTPEETATTRDIITGIQPAEMHVHSLPQAAVDHRECAIPTV